MKLLSLLVIVASCLIASAASVRATDGKSKVPRLEAKETCPDSDCPESLIGTPYKATTAVAQSCSAGACVGQSRPKLFGKVHGLFSAVRPRSLLGRGKCGCGN